MSDQTAPVSNTMGLQEHPESGEELLCFEVERETGVGRDFCKTTQLWVRAPDQDLKPGEMVTWGHRHAIIRGVEYVKPEDDRNPCLGLH